jgi:hypothetical protein
MKIYTNMYCDERMYMCMCMCVYIYVGFISNKYSKVDVPVAVSVRYIYTYA